MTCEILTLFLCLLRGKKEPILIQVRKGKFYDNSYYLQEVGSTSMHARHDQNF